MTYDPSCDDKILCRGDARRYRLTIREPKTGEVPDPPRIDLTDSRVIFEVKSQPEVNRLCPTEEVVITKTSDDANEIEVLDQTAPTTKGQCIIKLVAADTEFLAPGIYAYSVKVVTATGDPYTVVRGRFFLKGPATAAENMTPPC
jgi:hypothetical protein